MAKTTDTQTNGLDNDAWLETAAKRKFGIHNGRVIGGAKSSVNDSRVLFYVPPLPGFASVPEAQRAIVFNGVMRMVEYGVAQNATGNVQEAVNKAVLGGEITAPQESNRAESYFRQVIAESIAAKMEANKAAAKAAGTAGADEMPTKPTQAQIDAYAEKYREAHFGKYRDMHFANAANVQSGTEKKQRKAKKDAATLGDLSL